jgi:rare lipoprotein A
MQYTPPLKTVCKTLLIVAGIASAVLISPQETEAKQRSFKTECGKASWYQLTSRTASGEYANPNAMTAAHRTLPFGTKVRVTNLRNGKSVVVRINDRGPFIRGRVIDVTRQAAQSLGFKNAGITRVQVDVVGQKNSLSC